MAARCPHLSTRLLHTSTTTAPVPLTRTVSVLIPLQKVLRIAASLKLLSCHIGEAVRGCAPPCSAQVLQVSPRPRIRIDIITGYFDYRCRHLIGLGPLLCCDEGCAGCTGSSTAATNIAAASRKVTCIASGCVSTVLTLLHA